jgi:hypothetical protein
MLLFLEIHKKSLIVKYNLFLERAIRETQMKKISQILVILLSFKEINLLDF